MAIALKNKYIFWQLMLGDGRGYLIPLDSSHSARKGLNIYNPQSGKARFLKHCLSAGFASGILSRLISGKAIEEVNSDGLLDEGLFDFLKTTLSDDELTFAVSLGTPSAHRKPVIQIMKQNRILGYAKIGWNQLTLPLIRNEAETLKQLSEESLESIVVPSVLYSGEWQDKYICIQSAPLVKTESAPAVINSLYKRILENLSQIASQECEANKSQYWQRLLLQTKKVEHPYFHHVLDNAIAAINEKLSKNKLHLHFRHGDFAPWNILVLNEIYYVYDWEYASPEASAGWDLFHFFLQTHWLLQKQSAGALFRALISDQQLTKMFNDLYPNLRNAFREYLMLYLVDRLTFYAAEDASNLPTQEYLANIINLMLYRD